MKLSHILLASSLTASIATLITVTATTGTGTAQVVPTVCGEEDGSGASQVLPCLWDAGISGNGVGLSYWVSRGTDSPDQLCYKYLDPAAAIKYNSCDGVS